MRLVPIVLLLANLLVGASFLMGNDGPARSGDASPREIHPESIRIVGIDREPRPAPEQKTAAPAQDAPLACATWGSFPESQVAAAEARLAPLQLGARLSHSSTATTINYLVIIPPIASRTDLNLRVEDLKRLGVTDQFVINDGELRNGISLGYFKTEEAANRQLANLKAKGVADAIVKPKPSGNLLVTLHVKDVTAAERNTLEGIAGGVSGADLRFQPCAATGLVG
ncbi:MAG: SPOR domain-containing protein [Betaproteobacteria bacterium]|nr:SPOR domain-containing protein [Betaproteobacteria bacterium]